MAAAACALAMDAMASAPKDVIGSRFALANRCLAIESLGRHRFVAAGGADGYRADRRTKRRSMAFFAKPTGLGTYLLYDRDRKLVSLSGRGRVGRAGDPGRVSEWSPRRISPRAFSLRSTVDGRQLAVAAGGDLVLTGARSRGGARAFAFLKNRGCRRYPEAALGASGRPFRGTSRRRKLFGFADPHLHITADMRAGGRVIHGEAFDRFGITRALGRDERDHGPDGALDATGNLLRNGSPVGTHDTHGWPTFAGWPVHDTYTHQQTYYMWLKRAWAAGERLVVAQTVEDEPLCRIEPLRSHSCDETATIRLEVRRLRALQAYIDAQSGGPRRGWFRLVYSPRQARRAIMRGELAVLIGVESSSVFGCSEFMGRPQCTRADVDRGIRRLRRLGVRSLFVAHWLNNAFAGAALEGGAQGFFINGLNALQTGRFFQTGPCPQAGQGEEVTFSLPVVTLLLPYFPGLAPLLNQGAAPVYPPGRQCNVKGLTKLGAYLIRRLMANHMLIEADHLSERARLQVLTIAERHRYPLVSSHTDTGGLWTSSDLRRLYRLGGFAVARADNSAPLARAIRRLRRYRSRRRYFGVGLGTDTGGLAAMPGPEPDAAARPLRYPFRSYDRRLRFTRQRTGQRRYDLNEHGVAHYGLFPDLLAETQRRRGGKRALRLLFRSAEAYVETWERAVRHR
jgi:microsomal dipeptidase-like Zn-dependent dipeptidase